MGFKDLQVVVVMSVWLCWGYTVEVGAQVVVPGGLSNDAPVNSTFPKQWNVTLRQPSQTILTSQDGSFIFNLVLTNLSESSCAATVRHVSSDTVVWVANFNSTNSNGQSSPNSVTTCFLSFTNIVGLTLTNSSNADTYIWSTGELNLSGRGYFDTLQLGDNGCLYIMKNDSVTSVWKSFDYPGDTLVTGQKFMAGTSMSAAQVDQELSTGNLFSMRIDRKSLALFQAFQADGVSGDILYQSFPTFSGPNATQNDITYIQVVQNGLDAFYAATNWSLVTTTPGNWDYARLQPTGGLLLKRFGDSGSGQQLVARNNNPCPLPAQCGAFGICSQNTSCSCPEGFTNTTYDDNLHFLCQRKALPITADCNNSTVFVNVTGQVYVSLPNLTEPDNGASDCVNRCRGDCTCTNALHVRQGSSGACYLNVGSVPTISQVVDNGAVQTLFLRIPLEGMDGGIIPIREGGGGSARKTAALAFAGVAGALVLVLLASSTWWLISTRPTRFEELEQKLGELPARFSYKQLAESTNSFARRLGYGGVSSVYAGTLGEATNTKVAVKKLDDRGYKGKPFLAAVTTMASVAHPNLVPLVGYCKDGKHKLLVYELVNEGRALNWFLFNSHDSGPLISPPVRRAVALGTARALQHLHEMGVMHGALKPENIMITKTESEKEMCPKLVDYGLVSLSSRSGTLHTADARGARGYMAPEWTTTPSAPPITTKSDVYSLGVVILELVSGRRCLRPDASPSPKRFLPAWGFSLLRRDDTDLDSVLELVDPRLDLAALSQYDKQVLKGMAFVALWCVQGDASLRPSISHVVRMLEGIDTVNVPPLSPSLDSFAQALCASRPPPRHSPSSSSSSSSFSESADTRPR